MGHPHLEEQDSKHPAKSPQPIPTPDPEIGRSSDRFGPSVSSKNILQLQRTLGNQRVIGLLNGQIQRAPNEPKKLKTPPPWARVSSNTPLPGEHVKGITDREAPIMLQDADGHPLYTEEDRQKLKDALMTRHQENAQNGPEFAANFASSLLEIWTTYVTEDMADTADDASWSMLTKLVLFVLKDAALSYLFPAAAISKMAIEVATVLNQSKYVVAAAVELGQDAVENDMSNSKVQKRGQELRGMTSGLSANLQMVILSTFDEVSNSFYYQDWLDTASLQQLHLFRIPPAIPAVPQEKIDLIIAQQLTGLIHEHDSVLIRRHREYMLGGVFGYVDYAHIENGLFTRVNVDANGIEHVDPPTLNVPNALRSKLEGHAVNEMPQVPMLIELRCASPSHVYSPHELEVIEEIEQAWPQHAPLEIKIYPDGSWHIIGGGLKEMFYLYSLVNPLADLGAFALSQQQCSENETGLPETPQASALNLYFSLSPSLEDGARILHANSIGPLTIGKKP